MSTADMMPISNEMLITAIETEEKLKLSAQNENQGFFKLFQSMLCIFDVTLNYIYTRIFAGWWRSSINYYGNCNIIIYLNDEPFFLLLCNESVFYIQI